MKAIMTESQFWFCDICDKTFNIKSKSKHINYKTRKHKQNYGIVVVKEHEFMIPDFDEVN